MVKGRQQLSDLKAVLASGAVVGLRSSRRDGLHHKLEVHLLDFDSDLYNQRLEIHFVKRLRDEKKFSSQVKITVNSKLLKTIALEDDPADHRGILSWHSQLQNRKLSEAGSYGYLVKIPLNSSQIKALTKTGKLTVKLSVDNGGGLAVYGKDFGRYAFNPSVILLDK